MTQSFPWDRADQSVGCVQSGYSGIVAAVGLRPDIWLRAMQSFRQHRLNPLITDANTVTIVDFRLNTTETRLWVIDTRTKDVLVQARVSHGHNSGTSRGPGETFANLDQSNKSSIGAFVTLTTGHRSLGGITNGLVMFIRGLDPTNSRASSRGIMFHGAVYMAGNRSGRSHGCFATDPSVNKNLIDLTKGGSFVFAYGGDVCR